MIVDNTFVSDMKNDFKVVFVEFRCVIKDVVLNFNIDVFCDIIFFRFCMITL